MISCVDDLQKMASGEPISLNVKYVPDYQILKQNFYQIFIDPEKVVYSRRKHFQNTLPPKPIIEWLETTFDGMIDSFASDIPATSDLILPTLVGDIWCVSNMWTLGDSESLLFVSGNDNHWALIFQQDSENFIVTGTRGDDVFVMIPGFIVWKKGLKLGHVNDCVYNNLTSLIPYFKQITLTVLNDNK